jgi:hypothetical protein
MVPVVANSNTMTLTAAQPTRSGVDFKQHVSIVA